MKMPSRALVRVAATFAVAVAVARPSEPRVAHAQALGAADVIRSVERHHPRLAREVLRVDVAAGELVAAEGAFDPRATVRATAYPTGYYESRRLELGLETLTPFYGLRVAGSYRLTGGDVPGYDGRLETLDRGELRLQLQMPLLQDLRIDAARAGRRRATIDVTMAELQVQATRLELLRLATATYFRWLLAGAVRDVHLRLVELANARQSQLDRLAAAGSIPPIEARENERALLQRRARLVSAEQRLAQAAIALSIYLRDEDGRPRVPEDTELPGAFPLVALPSEPLDALVEEALDARPELGLLRSTLERSDVARELARTGRLPRLDLSLAVSGDLGEGTPEQRTRLGETVVEAGLSVGAPIPNRTGTGRFAAREADVEVAEVELGFLSEQVRIQVADAHVALLAAREAMMLEEASLALARDLAAAEYRRFEEGTSTLLLVNLREQLAFDTEVALAERRAELALAEALLALALGRTPG